MTGVELMAPAEPKAARLVGTLGLAGLLSGLLIVLVYEGTLPRIERNRAERLQRAVFEVVPGATAMQRLVWRDGALAVADPVRDAALPGIHLAYGGDGRPLGYAIAGAGAGFQDTIALLYGFDPARRRIIGMSILESRETPGLGDKIFKDPHFVGNFADLVAEPQVVLVKKGERTEAHQVDAITGATISSKAVVRIINDANAVWLPRLPPPGQEPPAPAGGAR